MYTNLKDAPANMKKHKGVELTLDQVNKLASIYDSLKNRPNVGNAMAVSWSTWEEIYTLKGGKWEKIQREKSESYALISEFEHVEISESSGTGLPREAIITVIKAGPTRGKNRFYDREALLDLVESKMLIGVKMYDAHPKGSEVVPGAIFQPRTCSEFWSYITEAFWDEKSKSVKAKVKLCDRKIKEKLIDAAEVLGVSLNFAGRSYKGTDGKEHIKKIVRVVSVDWVPEANAGGDVQEIIESAVNDNLSGKEVSEVDLKDLTIDMLKEQRPDLVEALEKMPKEEAAAEVEKAQEATKAAEETAKTAEAEAETAKSESADLKTKLDNQTKEMAEAQANIKKSDMQVKAFEMVESKCSDLNVLAKAEVLKTVREKSFSEEKEISEAIDTAMELVKKDAKFKADKKDKEPANDDGAPQLGGKSKNFAEAIGLSSEEQKRLAEI